MPETNTTLLTSYTPNIKLKHKDKNVFKIKIKKSVFTNT